MIYCACLYITNYSFTIEKEVNYMNFNVFRATHSRKVVGKSIYHKNDSIFDVINSTRIEDLEELVIRNFSEILHCSTCDEYHYFLMYKSWKSLFIKHSLEVFEELADFEDFETLVNYFPELESDVYRFLLNGCINNSFSKYLRNQIYIPTDILFPMVYMERYYGIKFPEIHEKVEEIIDSATTYSEFYAIISFFENELDIPNEVLKPIVDKFLNEDIERWTSGKATSDDFSYLPDFFRSREAYDHFMNELCIIFSIYGLNLYTYLVKHIGPLPEIISREHYCYEFCEI